MHKLPPTDLAAFYRQAYATTRDRLGDLVPTSPTRPSIGRAPACLLDPWRGLPGVAGLQATGAWPDWAPLPDETCSEWEARLTVESRIVALAGIYADSKAVLRASPMAHPEWILF